MIYTFYSYKGGVGRTMALANIAELFYRAGKRVLMIDWDLDAPGLEQFFFSPEELDKVRRQRGLIDLVMGYKLQMTTKLDLSDPEHLPFEPPHAIRQAVSPRSPGKGTFKHP
jgi:cellulose biosynthesis protein BcsQ